MDNVVKWKADERKFRSIGQLWGWNDIEVNDMEVLLVVAIINCDTQTITTRIKINLCDGHKDRHLWP